MADDRTAFPTPIATHGLAGFPATLSSLAQAREAIDAARLPAIRSGYAWLQAYNRLTEALASRSVMQIEAARIALNVAIVEERRRNLGETSTDDMKIAA